MTKFVLFAALLFAASSAQAETVYQRDIGAWHLIGDINYENPDLTACVFRTNWADGKRIQVNVFPQWDGSTNVTISITNPAWSFASFMIGENIDDVEFEFTSHQYAGADMVGYATVKDRSRLIFRGMYGEFVSNFIHMDYVTIFPGESDELYVRLEGTAALAGELHTCLSYIQDSPNYSGNF